MTAAASLLQATDVHAAVTGGWDLLLQGEEAQLTEASTDANGS